MAKKTKKHDQQDIKSLKFVALFLFLVAFLFLLQVFGQISIIGDAGDFSRFVRVVNSPFSTEIIIGIFSFFAMIFVMYENLHEVQ